MNRHLPLQGVRVIELCWIWAGPYLGQFLADLGAEVVKIEWHKRFDPYRTRGVEQMRGKLPQKVWQETSSSFHSLNRNKVGFTVDLKRPEGVELVKRLAARSDLLIENWTSGTLDGLGLGREALHAANPGLVIVSLTAFGSRSRLDGMRSYGLVTSALAGVESNIRDGDELVGSPTFVMSDPNAALYGLLAAMVGLRGARRGGAGVSIAVSQLEAMMSVVGMEAPRDAAAATVDGIHETRDGRHVAVTLPRAEAQRLGPLADWCRAHDADRIRDLATAAGGCAEELVRLADMPASPVFSGTDVRVPSEHPVTGPEELVAAPWRVNGQRPPLRKSAPQLGEGTDYVLRSILQLGEDEIAALREARVV